jgi:hypothetical protein
MSLPPPSTRWLTITQCVALIRDLDSAGRGISRWQLRRRLERWDTTAGGKLLRWRGAEGGVREVNAAVLRQLLNANPLERDLELSEVHERIDVIDDRVRALRTKSRKHGERIDIHEKRIDAQKRAIAALEGCARALAEA